MASLALLHRHCEERSDEAIQKSLDILWIASLALAMTALVAGANPVPLVRHQVV
jgi:hypothetical protein